MSIKFHFRPEENLVICVHKGVTPDDEFLATMKGMCEDDLFSISMNRLIDVRQATTHGSRSASALRQLGGFMSSRYPTTDTQPKIAVIAPTDINFGLSRMYQAYADEVPWDFVVFRAVDAALAYLGLPEDFMDDLDNDTQQTSPE